MKGECKFYNRDRKENERCNIQDCKCPYTIEERLNGDCDDYEERED
jgi:hypothetical protein